MTMRLRLTYEPRVKILSNDQVSDMLNQAEEPTPQGPGRRALLRGAAAAVPALLLGGRAARANPFAHRLPELYHGQNRALFQEILNDESSHVEILQALLDDEDNTLPPRPIPHFRNLLQHDVVAFVRAAATFENTGAGTYAGALFAIQQTDEYFPTAAGLTTVEARHAGFLNALLNEPLVPDSAPVDAPIPQSVALARVEPFIEDLNGGTVPSFDPDVSSDPNNFRIIDFLLLLEMVETAFYQVNVARFFGH
jgi:hypothetical protein